MPTSRLAGFRSLALLACLCIPARGSDGPVPTKLSQTSASTKDQFSLTVEIPPGCDMASISSDAFTVVTSRDFHQARQFPHLQPTGHVHEVYTNSFSNFSGGLNQANGPPQRAASALRTYVLQAARAGTLVLGPFQVLCPDGPLETQPQTIVIRDGDDSLSGKVVGIQDFAPPKAGGAAPPPAPARDAAPIVAPAPKAAAQADPIPDPDGDRGDLLTEKNLLRAAVAVLGLLAFVLLLANLSKRA